MIDDEMVVERLRRAHAAEPAPAVDPAMALRAGRRRRRHRSVARWSGVAAASAGALVVSAGLAGGWGRSPDRAAEPITEDVPEFAAVMVLDAYGGFPQGASGTFAAPQEGDTFLRGPDPAVDLEAGTVTLWTGGSYSCPTWPKAIRGFGDTIEIVVGLPDGVDVCPNDDYRTTTYVVELPSGFAPDGTPTVRVLSQDAGSPDGDVPADLPADDAVGCRPALTVCAMNRWLADILNAAELEPLVTVNGPLTDGDAVQIGDEVVSLTLAPLERDDRALTQVQRTAVVGAVVVEHGIGSAGAAPAATLTCGGFRIRLDSSPTMSADVLAQTAETIAGAIGQCPADLDELVALYPDLASPSGAEQVTARPAGCPEPLPGNLTPEEAAAYAGKCLVPEVFAQFGGPGFMGGGLIDDEVSSDIFIYWYGELDPATQALIDQAAADGVRVEVRPVLYSEAQLASATGAIMVALGAVGIECAGMSMGFEGIEVTITDPLRLEEATEVAQAAAGEIPVTVVVGQAQIGFSY